MYKNYSDKSHWIPVLFHLLLDPVPNLVGPAFNLLSHNRNLVHLRKESTFIFLAMKKNCSSLPIHQRKQLLLQILQILCKNVVYVPGDKEQNKRNIVMEALASLKTTAFEYLYFQAV